MQDRLQRVEALGAPPQRLRERRSADRHQHELLELELVVGVHAAVDHVHHRRRQDVGVRSAEVPVQRLAAASRRPRARRRATTPRIAFAPRADLSAVPSRSSSARSTPALVERVEPGDRLGDRPVHVRDGRQHALAAVARRRRHGARAPRARRSRRRSAPRPGRTRRRRARRRPRRSGCRGNPGSGARGRTRSATWGPDGTGRSQAPGDFPAADAAGGPCPGRPPREVGGPRGLAEPEPRVPVLRPVLGVGPQEHLLGPGGTAFGGGPEHERAARAPGRGTPRACRPTRPARGRRPRRARSTPRARRRRARRRTAPRPRAPTCRGSRPAARSHARSPSTCTGAGSRARAGAPPRTTPPRSHRSRDLARASLAARGARPCRGRTRAR